MTTETKRTWRKVHWPGEEYQWGVLEGPDTPQHRDESFGPFMDERIVAHCYHEEDADRILALEARIETLEAALRQAERQLQDDPHFAGGDIVPAIGTIRAAL